MDTHRVRRLRWLAQAPGPAEAFALRSLLREHSDACLTALDRGFDSVTPRDEVWHLQRLELKVRIADLQSVGAGGLAERVEAAVRAALAEAGQFPGRAAEGLVAARAEGPAIPTRSKPDSPPSRRSAVADGRQALLHYLTTALLPWTLAGLAPEQAQRALCDAAVQAAEAVLSGAETLGTVLPKAASDTRVGALLRWLPLLPAALRRRWVAAHAALPRLDPVVLDAWHTWIDDAAVDRIEWQALWLAGPLDGTELRTRVDAPRSSATSVEPPFLPALRVALATSERRSAASTNTAPDAPRATPASQDRSEIAATPESASMPAAAPMRAEAAAGSESAAPESLLVPLAGLVLLHPWLPRLLAGCGVLDESGKQIAPPLLPRACALLHALACGDAAEPAEHQLPFVKLLLGRAPDAPLTATLPALTPADREEIAALLAAVREHWSALRGTGVDGLRLSFLQRRGLLSRGDGAWQLRMQGESFDLLLGMLPWSIGLVRLPWMIEPLVVEWPTP